MLNKFIKIKNILVDHLPFIIAFLIVQIVFIAIITNGTWEIFGCNYNNYFDRFYDYQALSILQGRLDVPPEAIGSEAFIIDGKYYGYYGITPALIRIPLLKLFPYLKFKFTRFFLILWSCITCFFCYRIMLLIREKFNLNNLNNSMGNLFIFLFIITFGLGTVNIFLASQAFFYHEAVSCGIAFASVSIFCLLKASKKPDTILFIIALICSTLSILAKGTTGIGSLFAIQGLSIFLIIKRKSDSLRNLFVNKYVSIFFLSFFPIIFYMTINYLKFNEFSLPMEKHFQFISNQLRLESFNGKTFSLVNLPFHIYNYLIIPNIQILNEFPFVSAGYVELNPFSFKNMANIMPFINLPFGTPFFYILSIIGVISSIYQLKKNYNDEITIKFLIVASSSALGICILFMFIAIAQYYFHEFALILVLFSSYGLYYLISNMKHKFFTKFLVILSILSIYSCYVNISISMTNQKLGDSFFKPMMIQVDGNLIKISDIRLKK